ncbi:MAG: YkgJ family cysteine cluster protein [Chloroflexota bacterium]|jgi:Fe-S-cluster containining protein
MADLHDNGRNREEDVSPEALVQQLEKSLAGGLRFANYMAATNQENAKENMLLVHALVELLVSKGLIHVHEIEERKKMLLESLKEEEKRKPRIYLVEVPDGYQDEDDLIIDCAAYHEVCRGGCCTLWFALSVRDLDGGHVKWNYLRPYGIAQGEDGYCVHFDRATYRCGIYEHRPVICRTYDCRKDKKIWVDFEKRTLAPELTARFEKIEDE